MSRLAAVSCLALVVACSPSGDGGGAAGPERSAALAQLSLDASGSGRVQFASQSADGRDQVFDDVALRFEDDAGDVQELRAASMVLTAARLDDDTPTFDAMTLNEVAFTDEGDVAIDTIRLESPNAAAAAMVARLLSGEPLGDDIPAAQDLAFDLIAVNGVRIAGGEDEGALTIQGVRFENLENATFGAVTLDDLAVTAETDDGALDLSLEAFAVRGLDLGFIEAFQDVSDLNDPDELSAALSASGLNDPYAKRYDTVAVRDFSLDVAGLRIGLQEMDATLNETRGGLESVSSFGPLSVTVDPSAGQLGAQAVMGLSMLGFDEGIEITGSSRQVADPTADRVMMTENRVTVRDAFDLNMTMDLSGVADYVARAAELDQADAMNPDAVTELVEPLLLHAMEIRLTDDSIVERALQAAATTMGQSPEDLRTQAGAFLSLATLGVPEGPARDAAVQATTALAQFVAEPGVLVVRLDPGEDGPVRLADAVAGFMGGSGDPLPLTFANEPN